MTFTAPERKEGEPPRLIVVSNRLPVTIKKDAKTGEYTYKVGLSSSSSSLCLCEAPRVSRSLILLFPYCFWSDVVIYTRYSFPLSSPGYTFLTSIPRLCSIVDRNLETPLADVLRRSRLGALGM
jgi:hypothetical protein